MPRIDQAALRARFDRTAEYAALVARISAAKASLPTLGPRRGLTALRRLEQAFDKLARIDFFAGQAKEQAVAALASLKARYAELYARNEPRSSMKGLRPIERARYQKRVWATRKAPWVDRLASAWLIKRFIDRDAKFAWIARPSECPKKAVGFDYDGAEFTHVKNRVTFEVLAAAFGLDQDPALAKIGGRGPLPRRRRHPGAGCDRPRDHAEGRQGKSARRRCAARRGDADLRSAALGYRANHG